MKPRFNPLLRISAAVVLACTVAHADTLTWNAGSNSNWNTTDANWTGDTWDNSVPDSAIFGATGVGTVTLTTGISVDDITFNTAGYTVTGNTLTVLGGGNSLITANANATISSNIAGGDLVKNGSATLTLSGTNTYGGGTVVNDGTLEITSMSNISSNWFAMDNTSTLRYIGTGSESTSRDIWINNAAGTRTFEIVNSGTSLTLASGGGQINRSIRKTGDGTLVISRNVEGGPETIIDDGVLEVSTSGKLYGSYHTTTPVIKVNSGCTLRLNGWSWDAAGSIANLDYSRDRLVVNGGTIEYTGNSNFNPGDPGSSSRNLTIGTGGATLKASSASGQTWTLNSANGNLINNTGLTLDGAGAGEIQKVIEGSGSVTKTGGGTWTLSGVNTYNGTTTVSTGTLALSGSGSISESATVAVASGATLDVSAVTGGNWTLASGKKLTGSGLVNGATTIAGTHAPGSSPGVQSFSGNLTYASTSIFDWELASSASGARGTQYDGVNVGGTLAGAAGAAFNVTLNSGSFTDTFWNTNQTWSDIFKAGVDGSGSALNIASVFSTITGTGIVWDSLTSRGNVDGQGYFTMSTSTLSWTAVPEPTSALAGLLLTAGLLRRRR